MGGDIGRAKRVQSGILCAVAGGTTQEAVHLEPVWRDRSDFVIAAVVPDGGDVETG